MVALVCRNNKSTRYAAPLQSLKHQFQLYLWQEWGNTLAEEIERAKSSGNPDLGDTYYQHWLSALEKLLDSKGLTTPSGLSERREAWRCAYLNTPHGQPITLENRDKHQD